MKSKIIAAITAGSLVVGMLALSGCFESSYPDYGYGYNGYERGYYAEPAPVVVRDYGNHHWWQRDRDDRDNDHRREAVSNDHDRDSHARATNRDRDHDHDAH